MKDFFRHFISILATLSSIATLLSFITGWQIQSKSIWIPILLGLSILVICVGYAFWQTRKKKKITLNINSSLKLTIQEADIFLQNGVYSTYSTFPNLKTKKMHIFCSSIEFEKLLNKLSK